MELTNRINEDPAFLNIIDYEEDNIRIQNALKKQAQEEGRAEGKEQGRKEILSEVIKKLIEKGLKEDEIYNITGCTKEEFNKYAKGL